MFKKLLEKDFVFLDGGMGTMIQSTGVDAGHIPELLNITNPDIIKDIHRRNLPLIQENLKRVILYLLHMNMKQKMQYSL